MDASVPADIMSAPPGKVEVKIRICNRTVMTVQTVVLGPFKMKQPFMPARGMGPVAVSTSVIGNRLVFAPPQVLVTRSMN
jgi:hypothetical protein